MMRAEALELVKGHVHKESNLKHMVAVGAVMRQAAVRLEEDPEHWEVTGILHDLDFEECHGMQDHALISRDLLQGKVPDDIIQAILAHNHEATGVPVDNRLKRALMAADAVSGLVIACALVLPSKKLAEVKVSSIAKKFGNKDFARGVDRGRIMVCEELGIPRDEFLSVALEGMKLRSDELGL
ncbi:MAG TPA: HD domain-containing protein [Methanomassiliicoccales archaeon]|jgi:predicted hydrolase (HD superfamily)|nr:HD domain-containing protein [Methanomassiliicoccales archaeon]HQQ25081.1 HD domain-containing protein [Methanomassiliicoccales archaeon]